MIDDALLRRIARPATELALSFAERRAQIAYQEKGPGDFVSAADRAVEAAIRAAIRQELGDVPVIGEEEGGALDASSSGWVIDPIDGTSNFLRGLPLWGISIGQLEHGEPVRGAMVLPELGITLTGIRGQGMRLNGAPAGAPPPASPIKTIALGENDHEPGSVTDERAQRERERGLSVVRYRSAVFSLANVALHRLDGYVEHGCRIWDIVAGWIICREAGADVAVGDLGDGRYSIEARWK